MHDKGTVIRCLNFNTITSIAKKGANQPEADRASTAEARLEDFHFWFLSAYKKYETTRRTGLPR